MINIKTKWILPLAIFLLKTNTSEAQTTEKENGNLSFHFLTTGGEDLLASSFDPNSPDAFANFSSGTSSSSEKSKTKEKAYAKASILHIDTGTEITYTKVELIDKSTGKLIIEKKVEGSKSALDMSNVNQGIYTIILTNEAGNIKVEDLLVMKD